jgi:carbon-monoxide dehydrogenase large subunit
VSIFTGVSSQGQGHHTTFAQIVADKLGLGLDQVEVVHGDTDKVQFGMGTYGSRSLSVGGSALVKSLEKVIAKGRTIAAHLLEAAEEDVVFNDGTYHVAGAPARKKDWGEVVLMAYLAHDLPEGIEPGLEETTFYDPSNFVYPFGTHIAIVEIDRDTGEVTLDRYIAVDDCGNLINPMIVTGQVHGGVAQGVGQALWEEGVYDESGQLVTATMLDYALPRAHRLPFFETAHTITPCPHNPLGVKGIGEAGSIASPVAVTNAVVDALSHLGIKHLDMPHTPERVWRAMTHATTSAQGDA